MFVVDSRFYWVWASNITHIQPKNHMRQRFEQQLSLRIVPITDVIFPLKSRDELPPVLMALQYIFITPELNEKVFSLLEQKICKNKKKTGRNGMDLWHILVLAVVRNACNTNWDTLESFANHHELVRMVMGVHASAFIESPRVEFSYQTILDNVSLIDEALLQSINLLVVEAGHKLIKKKEEVDVFILKTDSYVVETNVHFPTDLNLLWDSLRKCLDMVEKLQEICDLSGWRKIKSIRKSLKSQFRATSQQVFTGKTESLKKESVKQYLYDAKYVESKVSKLLASPPDVTTNRIGICILIALNGYKDYVTKFIDQIDRRLLKGEQIPASEKVFSVFEPHTEWITKGKQNKKVELGHLILITTDQHQFIVDYKVMEKQKDAAQVSPLCERLKENFTHKKIISHSFDKGFFSYENLKTLEDAGVDQPILPKKGRHNKADKEREGTKKYKKLRNAHSAVESNINMLEHHGLNRCMDKGLRGFKRCVGLSILAYNMHILGNALRAKEKEKLARLKAAA